MPIDFAAIAAQFRDPLLAQTKPLEPLFEKLEEAVKKIADDAEKAERATRAYPILRYYGDALTVRVVPLEGIALLESTPPLGFVEGLRTGGREFLAGIGWTRTAVTQELAVTRIAGVTAAALQGIVDSIDRFATPTPAMFDPRERRLSDVFGLLVLAYNSLLGPEARKQLVGTATGAMGLYEEYKKAFPDTEPPTASTVGAIDRIVATLDGLALTFLDLVLLLPVLGDVLAVLVHDGSLAAKRRILTELSRVEAEVVAMRTAAIEGVISAAGFGAIAQSWLSAARAVIMADLVILTTAAPALLDGLLTGIRRFAEGVTAWGKWLTDLAETIRSVVVEIMGFDLFGFALRQVLPDWIVSRLPLIPKVTVDDIIGLLIGEATSAVRDALNRFFDAALFVLWVLPGDYYYNKVKDIAKVVNIVLTPTAFTLPPDVMPKGPLAGFPDVGEAFFGSGRGAALVASIDRFGTELRGSVASALGGAETMLTDLGSTFAAEADRAVVLGSPVQMRSFALDAAELSERVFGPEADRVREQAASRRPDVLAEAFESAVTSGGFALVGSAIPAYVGEMRRFWEQKRPPVDRPTSPHILARHGRLGAVRIPRMTVRAPGRTPDRALATAVAERFHSAVDGAYLEGRREFERLGGAPLRRPSRGARPVRRSR